MQKHYIVVGSGRTGSHWVEQIVKFIDPESRINHTNHIQDLLNWPTHDKKNSIVILCRRHDIFSAAISYFVAEHTGEWFEYTNDRKVEPFKIDEKIFEQKIKGIKTWDIQFDTLVRPVFSTVVDIWFEDLVNAVIPEHYVAHKANIPVPENQKLWKRNKNTRKYTKLVTNYKELQVNFLQNQALSTPTKTH